MDGEKMNLRTSPYIDLSQVPIVSLWDASESTIRSGFSFTLFRQLPSR